MKRLGMCPYPTGTKWEQRGNPHLKRLVQALQLAGWEVVPVTPADLSHPASLAARRIEVLHLHWAASLFELDRFLDAIRLPAAFEGWRPARLARKKLMKTVSPWVRRLFGSLFLKVERERITKWAEALRNLPFPIVWQQHDLLSHHLKHAGEYLQRADELLHRALYDICDGIVLHELSCADPVFRYYAYPKPYVVTTLGPLSVVESVTREDARSRLGMRTAGRVLAYIGTARKNRNPRAAARAFLDVAIDNARMIVAGHGCSAVLRDLPTSQQFLIMDGFLEPETIRDVYCACDFVVNDAYNYLTSGVVRTAMEYGRPVITYRFGSSVDMACDAAVYIDDLGLRGAMRRALSMSPTDYQRLSKAAFDRNAERPWSVAAERLTEFYTRLLHAHTGK